MGLHLVAICLIIPCPVFFTARMISARMISLIDKCKQEKKMYANAFVFLITIMI
jgi:hypothetical protein